MQPLPSRSDRLQGLLNDSHDVLIVGGGITGAGVALDLAQRGLRVAILEREDWAAKTSSASSRLIHGGLRYLEQASFGLVRESCIERKRLLNNAAGLVWPERFLFPLHRGAEVGPWKLGAGLLLYSALSIPHVLGCPGPLSRAALSRSIPGIRQEGLRGGGHYLDGASDDARLCLAVIQSAMQSGACALSRMEVLGVEGAASAAELRVRDRLSGEEHELKAKAVVLAGGPYTDALRASAGQSSNWLAPTRGAHILVPRERLFTDGAVILPSAVDGRILFLLPWQRYTVIGTTDIDVSGTPNPQPVASAEEVRYLLDSANALVPAAELGAADVVSSYAGLRPLLRAKGLDPSARSREERIERERSIYTIAGGKLTGYRHMAETLGARIAKDLDLGNSRRASPTRSLRLHGALAQPVGRPSWSSDPASLGAAEAQRRQWTWQVRYGSLAAQVEASCNATAAGWQPLSPDTWAGELDWAVTREDCLGAEDFFFRRTDLGLEPRAQVEARVPEILSRMAMLLGWDSERQNSESKSLLTNLAGRHAWREKSLG